MKVNGILFVCVGEVFFLVGFEGEGDFCIGGFLFGMC